MSYLGRSAKLSRKTQEKVSFLATAGQTSKTGLSYVPTFVEVSVNGILLTDVTDYTATSGSSITFSVALELNDEVTVVSLKTFALADHYTKVESDAAHYTKSAADSRFEPIDSAYTKAEADANLAALVDSSPAALNTLNELAAALGDDANFSTTVTNSIATKLPLAGGTITGDLVISYAAGSSNWALSSTSGDDFTISRNGSEKLLIDGSTGNVGIGASSPSEKLTIQSGNINFMGGTNDAQYIKFGDTGDDDIGSILYYHGNNNMVFTANASEAMRISGGNVGIGTASPTGNLSVHSSNNETKITLTDGNTGTTATDGLLLQSGAANAYLWNYETGNLIVGNSNAERMRIDSSGKVGIGTGSPAEMLEIYNTSSPAIQLNDGGDYKSIMRLAGNDLEIRGSSGSLEFYNGAADGDSSALAMTINNSGSVGIGISSPLQKLAVKVGADIIVGVWGDNSAGYGAIQSANVANNAYKQLRFDASSYHFAQGNVGIGVVPEAHHNSHSALQVGGNGVWTSLKAQGASGEMDFQHNAYYSQAHNGDRYISTDEATKYRQVSGAHQWYTAGSGSADAAISWRYGMQINNDGIVTKPLQPAFSANAVDTSNVPINTFQTVNLTEIFDNNADFNPSTDAFTAPVGGKYQLNGSIRVDNLLHTGSYMYIRITTSNRGYYSIVSPPAFDSSPQYWGLTISHLADMDAGDTATLSFYIAASSVSADIHSESIFSGYLAC